MKVDELREEINIEIELIENILHEVSAIRSDLANRQPTAREKTAAATFLAQIYSGIENILKRICKFHKVALPAGDTWHLDLFKRFCVPSYSPLPELFDKSLEADIAPFRQFRHVVYHSYGFQLDWERMKEGIEKVADVSVRFRARLSDYLQSLKSE
jgi:hypothetical protein